MNANMCVCDAYSSQKELVCHPLCRMFLHIQWKWQWVAVLKRIHEVFLSWLGNGIISQCISSVLGIANDSVILNGWFKIVAGFVLAGEQWWLGAGELPVWCLGSHRRDGMHRLHSQPCCYIRGQVRKQGQATKWGHVPGEAISSVETSVLLCCRDSSIESSWAPSKPSQKNTSSSTQVSKLKLSISVVAQEVFCRTLECVQCRLRNLFSMQILTSRGISKENTLSVCIQVAFSPAYSCLLESWIFESNDSFAHLLTKEKEPYHHTELNIRAFWVQSVVLDSRN